MASTIRVNSISAYTTDDVSLNSGVVAGSITADSISSAAVTIDSGSITAASLSAVALTTSTLNAISLPSASIVDGVVDPGIVGEFFTMSITSMFTGTLSADFHNELGVLSASLKVVCSSSAA